MPHAPMLKCRTTGRSRVHNNGNLLTPQGHRTGSVQGQVIGSTSVHHQYQPPAGPFVRCHLSHMGKRNKSVSNGAYRNGDRPKPPSPTRSKHSKKSSLPQSLWVPSVVVAMVAGTIFLVTQTDSLSYFTSSIPHDTFGSKTPSSSESKSSSKTSSSSSTSSQNKSAQQTSEKPRSPSKSKSIATGGWRLADETTNSKFDSSICTVDRRSFGDITSDEFEEVYRYKKPVIVTFPNGARDWTQPDHWSIRSLKREYGLWSVLAGNSIEIVRRGGNGNIQTSFTEFVDRMMKDRDAMGDRFYIFDRSFYNDSSLPKTLKPPKYFEIKDGVDDSIFFLGASGSGVSFHKHADAWNGVIFGRKRWFLYDIQQTPPGGVYPGFSQGEWYTKVYPHLDDDHKPLECIQEAGEIFYLPEGFYHGTINLGDTVAIGIQKKDASTKEEKLFYEELSLSHEIASHAKSVGKRKKLESRKIQIFNKLQQLLPENSEVKMKLGQLYSDLERLRDGLELTQKAVELDPNFVIAHLNMGKMYAQLHKNKEAEVAYNTALGLNPNLWDIHATFGEFLLANNRPAEAVKHFKKGTELQPDMMRFWVHLRQAQQLSGDRQGAAITAQAIKHLGNT